MDLMCMKGGNCSVVAIRGRHDSCSGAGVDSGWAKVDAGIPRPPTSKNCCNRSSKSSFTLMARLDWLNRN